LKHGSTLEDMTGGLIQALLLGGLALEARLLGMTHTYMGKLSGQQYHNTWYSAIRKCAFYTSRVLKHGFSHHQQVQNVHPSLLPI